MLQEIAPHRFYNEFETTPPSEEDLVVVLSGNQVLVAENGGFLRLPRMQEVGNAAIDRLRYLFRVDDARLYYLPYQLEPFADYTYQPVGRCSRKKPEWLAFAVSVAGSLGTWYVNHRFCGRCGARMLPMEEERAMVCPTCGTRSYPTICPAVIVGVIDGNRLLLSRYAGRRGNHFSLIAGYAEVGETIEETVHREVMEEVGLRVKNLQFYKSQPWPFSDTLLMGFFVELDGDDVITLQEDELSAAAWYRWDELPEAGSDISLTYEMVEVFRKIKTTAQ